MHTAPGLDALLRPTPPQGQTSMSTNISRNIPISTAEMMFFDLATGTSFRTYEWLLATPTLEIKIESACQGSFPGRFYVRNRREQNS